MPDEVADGADWRALLERASACRRAGRTQEAIAAYRALLRINPDLPDSWYNLAWLQRQAREFTGALASYGEALERDVSDPHEVHLNRAVIFSDHLHSPHDAKQELEAALAIAPAYVPALLNLGNLHEDEGDRSAAQDAYRRVLNAEPGHVLALARLAGASEFSDPGDLLIGSITDRLGDPALTGADRADLGFALGRALDQVGDYTGAFAAYAAANEASRRSFGNHYTPYDPKEQERFVGRIIATFSSAEPQPAAPGGRVPLFICGMFRSGSTLVEQILSRHPAISAGGELDLLPAIIGKKLHPYPEAADGAAPALIEACRRAYLDAFARIDPSAAIVTDKRPDNFLHIGLIKQLFPSARIIRTRRNALDNVLSLYFLHLDPTMAYAFDLEHAAHWYAQQERLVAHWKRVFPADILDVDYDELVRAPEPTIRAMVDFCGVEWKDSMLDVSAARGAVRTASVWQVREPLYQRSSGRWRNYRAQLSGIENQIADAQSGFE